MTTYLSSIDLDFCGLYASFWNYLVLIDGTIECTSLTVSDRSTTALNLTVKGKTSNQFLTYIKFC